mmetsp:Transcript_82656/g.129120  ORF Transcript_82656/g.129120 Transcript_82656/m.129120 type:complete len:610 (-) Transcript_82656:58-1887(-)
MGEDAEAPPVPLHRLRLLGPAEPDLYYGLFSAVGGSLQNPVPGGTAAQVLETTRLPQHLLQKIWAFADEFGTGSLDWEGFCVACRLCAHVQNAADEAEAEQAAEGGSVAEIPSSLPFFEGYEGKATQSAHVSRQLGMHRSSGESVRRVSSGSLEFEALAFGGVGTGESVRPAGDFSRSAIPILPAPSAAGQWQGGVVSGTGGFLEASSATGALGGKNIGDQEAYAGPDATPSAAMLIERLCLRHFESSSSSSLPKRHENAKRDPAKLVADELAQGREKLEQSFADKRRLQGRLETMRQRLASVRADREEVVAELTNRQCDVQHLFAEIDFTRLQIETVEHETGPMRAIRQAFSHEDITRMEQTRRKFQSERISLGEEAKDLKDRRALMQMSQDMLMQDRKNVRGLCENLKRPQRRKMELQSRQILLLEDQRQAEEDRGRMLYALEMERVKLHSLRSERMDISSEMRHMLQEAHKLSRDSGVEPAVFAKCFLPDRPDPAEMQEPLDPIAVPSSSAVMGAWGPAAEYLRHGEDASSWRRTVYQTGVVNSDATRFSISGGYMDPTAMEQWAKFGKGGPPQSQKFYSHSKHHGGQYLGVPSGQEPPSTANLAR